MFIRGAAQMRQSEGNKTAKRLLAIWAAQSLASGTRSVREAIEGLATAALAWLARILSSLLLKTASVLPAETFGAGDFAIACLSSSITAAGSARQRYVWTAAPGLPPS
jgi:hypothetical protein